MKWGGRAILTIPKDQKCVVTLCPCRQKNQDEHGMRIGLRSRSTCVPVLLTELPQLAHIIIKDFSLRLIIIMMNSSSSLSILSCLKKDVKKALHYFQEREPDTATDEEPGMMRRSKSSSLLDMVGSRSCELDPSWFFNQMNSMENDMQDRLTLFSSLIEDDAEPKVKRPHGERNMLLQVTQEDGMQCKALPTDTHWDYLYVCHPMIQCSKFHRLFRR
jgi:hypothetical protein